MHVGHLLSRAALRWPERPAWLDGDTVVTFRDAEARVNRLAHALIALGARRGDRVGMLVPNCYQGLVVFVVNDVRPDISVSDIFRGVWPFIFADLITLAVITAFPELVTFLVARD